MSTQSKIAFVVWNDMKLHFKEHGNYELENSIILKGLDIWYCFQWLLRLMSFRVLNWMFAKKQAKSHHKKICIKELYCVPWIQVLVSANNNCNRTHNKINNFIRIFESVTSTLIHRWTYLVFRLVKGRINLNLILQQLIS